MVAPLDDILYVFSGTVLARRVSKGQKEILRRCKQFSIKCGSACAARAASIQAVQKTDQCKEERSMDCASSQQNGSLGFIPVPRLSPASEQAPKNSETTSVPLLFLIIWSIRPMECRGVSMLRAPDKVSVSNRDYEWSAYCL